MLGAALKTNADEEEYHVAVSRRKFLKTGTMGSLSAMIPLKSVVSVFGQQPDAEQFQLFKVPPEGEPDERLTEETFSRYLNSEFRIHTSPFTAVNLELIKVKRWDPQSTKLAAKGAKLESFSILFRGPKQPALKSMTYTVSHDQMGMFDLFISPVDDRKKQRLYQAVFNRFQS